MLIVVVTEDYILAEMVSFVARVWKALARLLSGASGVP